jgi:hypothetical protein
LSIPQSELSTLRSSDQSSPCWCPLQSNNAPSSDLAAAFSYFKHQI